jgi:hypothetical protein
MKFFVSETVALSLKLLSEMDSASTPSNEDASTTGSNTNTFVRRKCNLAWNHVIEKVNEEKNSYRCVYCGKLL